MNHDHLQYTADKAALQFYIESGVLDVEDDTATNRYTLAQEMPNISAITEKSAASGPPSMGAAEGRAEAVKIARAADTLENLKESIAAFDGLAIKKTATNIVFADGHPQSSIMLIGDAPGADEDRTGIPFAGHSGALLDKILSCIDLDRGGEDPLKSVYLSTILNWRPPGNRNPSPAEIEISMPLIERHIQLIKPKLIILCGEVSAKALLGSDQSLSRLRKRWHDYLPQTPEFKDGAQSIPAIVTYSPAYLLNTPAQKRSTWADMLEIKAQYGTLI